METTVTEQIDRRVYIIQASFNCTNVHAKTYYKNTSYVVYWLLNNQDIYVIQIHREAYGNYSYWTNRQKDVYIIYASYTPSICFTCSKCIYISIHICSANDFSIHTRESFHVRAPRTSRGTHSFSHLPNHSLP